MVNPLTDHPSDFKPFVSIVVPVYDGQDTIQACIESLLNQDYDPGQLEIIVVDNNSTDQTCEIVQKYPVKILHETIQSSYAARNRGAFESKGEIIAFTDSDCVPASNWIKTLISPFQSDPSIGGVGGRVLSTEPQSDVEEFLSSIDLFGFYSTDSTFLPTLLTNNCAYQRMVFLKENGFNSNLFTAGDVDLSWRIQLNQGSQVAYNLEAYVYHKQRSTVKSMARLFRRYGYSEIILDTIYKNHQGYKRTPSRQIAQMGRQVWAIIIYIRSIIYRGLSWKMKKKSRQYAIKPLFLLIRESSVLWGKLLAIWTTRFFIVNPTSRRMNILNG